MKKRVLIGCEFSGIIRDAFIALGYDAISCDLIPSEKPGPHYLGDIRDILSDGFSIMIAHPPCQYLCSSGIHWNGRVNGRQEKTEDALAFFKTLLEAPIDKICLENPIGIVSSRIRKPDQIIQPYQFGENYSKATCLWLKNLKPLNIDPDNYYPPRMIKQNNGKLLPRWGNQTDSGQNRLGPSPSRSNDRSRTFQGIALAMSHQWSL